VRAKAGADVFLQLHLHVRARRRAAAEQREKWGGEPNCSCNHLQTKVIASTHACTLRARASTGISCAG
jgi:hypothetical protein